MIKIHISSLGCAKNLVDSEVLAGQLHKRKYRMTDQPENADIVIVNTCGFINPAKEESIQAIFEAVELKKTDPHKRVFVAGCLSQRYRSELKKEIPELDGIFGTEDYKNILSALGQNRFDAENIYRNRILSAPSHYAYMKISEGCNHTCAFCAIPMIRGKHRSRTIDDILKESSYLAGKGVKELLLVSQDTSYYGKDIYGRFTIIQLLEELAKSELFVWIRPLYWYPTNFPLAYIDLVNKYPAILPYIDMPIQHASDNVLRQMRRAERRAELKKLYTKLRREIPGIALRTTLILGHPGETEDDFSDLMDFIQEIRFDRIGTFVYSDEEDTCAYDLPKKVEPETAARRQDELMAVQRSISLERNQSLIGSTQNVLIDSYQHSDCYYTGRTNRDAPDIDNEVIIASGEYNPDLIGSFWKIKVTDASEYELYGNFDVLKKK